MGFADVVKALVAFGTGALTVLMYQNRRLLMQEEGRLAADHSTFVPLLYQNPVVGPAVCADCADPGAFYDPVTKMYYLVNTGQFTIRESANLVNWTLSGKNYFTTVPVWANENFWAPELHQFNATHYAVVYCSNDKLNKNIMSVGIGFSTSASGPFIDIGHPIASSNTTGYIDPTLFTDPATNTHYLLYKSDMESALPNSTPIWMVPLSATGDSIVGAPAIVLTNDEVWEYVPSWVYNIEAPFMIYNKATQYYYLFYSGAMYNGPYYNVGVARSKAVTGPYEKFTGPILHSRWGSPYIAGVNATFSAPGHCSVVEVDGVSGNYVMMYHTYWTAMGGRHTMMDPLVWVDGWPRVLADTPSYQLSELNFASMARRGVDEELTSGVVDFVA